MLGEPTASTKWVAKGKYFCPMHTHIEQQEAGDCPICGMSLEHIGKSLGFSSLGKVESKNDHTDSNELLNLRRRLVIVTPLTILLMVLSMISMPNHSHNQALMLGASEYANVITQILLTTFIVFFGGGDFLRRGLVSLSTRSLNMFTLIGLGIISTYSYSIWLSLFLCINARPAILRALATVAFSHYQKTGFFFESAAVITTLTLLGQYLELKARRRAGHEIELLLSLAPNTALRIEKDGSDSEVALANVQVGNQLRVRAGEKVPVDGIIISGHATIDQSMLTGEMAPAEKDVGDLVQAGTINGLTTFVMQATTRAEDSLLAGIIRTIEQVQRTRIPSQDLVDKIASFFVPLVVLIAISTFFYWFHRQAYDLAITNAIAVMIIACPCALGLATPMSVLVASGLGARHGILVREAKALQKLANVDLLAIDKTGTLTEGKPVVSFVKAVSPWTNEQVIEIAASLEQGSQHPLAQSVLNSANKAKTTLTAVVDQRFNIGQGVTGTIGGDHVVLGSEKFLQNSNIDLAVLLNEVSQLSSRDATALFLAVNQQAIGLIGIEDAIKPSSRQALSMLENLGIRVVMLTGDRESRAKSIASQLKLNEFHANLLPEDKAQFIRKYKEGKLTVAMAGDGINDAPALAESDVGIAMAEGSDITIETASVVLIHGDLTAVVKAIHLSKLLMGNIAENLLLAFAYNIIAIPLAAGVLTSVVGISFNPALASLAMSLSSLSVIGNALRLRSLKL